MAVATVQTAIAAENTYTDTIPVGKGHFNFSLWGTFVGTVFVQRSFDGGTTWLDVASFTVATEDVGLEPDGALYRAGIKTGGYTSGTANVRLSQ